MRSGFTARHCGAVLAAGILSCAPAFACGLSWSKPASHFDGVDYQGDVYLVEEIGKLELSADTVVPVLAVFESDNGRTSPYAGTGWTLPLLEAKIIPLDENTFRLDQPDGRFRLFWRDGKNPSLLNGQGGWKAEIRGDTITAWAECGSRIILTRGRITQLQVHGKNWDYVYSGNRISEIREGGIPLLKVQADPGTGEVTGISLGSKGTLGFEQGQKPRVQAIAGQNVVAGMEKSLNKVVLPDGTVRTFEFAVDARLQPTLKVDGNREITWNAATRKILRDGDWEYKIEPGDEKFANAQISRSGAAGTEFWFHDRTRGEETIISQGRKQKRSWFASGKMAGKPRSIVTQDANGEILSERFSYNENGVLIRKSVKGPKIDRLVVCDDEGAVVEVIVDNKVLWKPQRHDGT